MTSRRDLLATLGTVSLAGFAGCSALPFGDGQDEKSDDVALPAATVEPISWPESPFPVAVPSTLAETHRDRARELLTAVPVDPAVPNSAVAEELQSDRERAADRLETDTQEPWPTQELSRWRDRRHAAATVRGTYRAATGEDDAEAVTERRRAVRDELSAFVSAHEYRASSPLEAVLVHAPIEELVSDCRRRTRPGSGYPADPVADPFQAGDAVGLVEFADATLADARGLRDAYLADRSNTSAQWVPLSDTSEQLQIALAHTRSTVQDFLEHDEPPFDADLDGTAGRWLFTEASRRVETMAEEHDVYRDDGDYARAILVAGRTLAAIEALRTTIDGINGDAYRDEVTVESVTRTAERAREALAAIDASESPELAAQLCRPALDTVELLPEVIEEGYADAGRVQGELAWAELYARAVPAATAFVSERLG
ncbi:hypothetical protein [Halapricum desulfuricans]|uniref:Uncharacterized protein n=1 Tax=Halapricum desulfuricans TaxID=2841257 RepID=A0A897MYX8_9EURY|nr:hypothetical protein [Halapricum desulfuricans]QSG05188.1 Uncharacterized protein HSR121_0836 [Halapricum desulfuricans]